MDVLRYLQKLKNKIDSTIYYIDILAFADIELEYVNSALYNLYKMIKDK